MVPVNDKLLVTQLATGKFHHLNLANQLYRHGKLQEFWSGYPRSLVIKGLTIPSSMLKTFPLIHTPYMALRKFNTLHVPKSFSGYLEQFDKDSFDWVVKMQIDRPTIVLALSSVGLQTGRHAQANGGAFICDRGSAHILDQDLILRTEYKKWGLKFPGINRFTIAKELEEYEVCDRILVPSDFARATFVNRGIDSRKVVKIPYGVDVSQFSPSAETEESYFTVLFVGNFSIQKGAPYLLEALRSLQHPSTRLWLVGTISSEMKDILGTYQDLDIQIFASISQRHLRNWYSKADVTVLPSVQDGFGMVLAEALACGCPIIASEHTGARELITSGDGGYIVPAGNSRALKEALEMVISAGDSLRHLALEQSLRLNGWTQYGDSVSELIETLNT